ncbi:lysoplasmalogenase family protein [Sphingomonas sp. MMS24-J45]|uniref:lysoplasmalogenase family protein n=1 Tax=Sphingomonas sp. MMS24-J45 TaxID=3238806 RepID=UPI0038506457
MLHLLAMALQIPKPALFAAALLAGLSYWAASHILSAGTVMAAWKGAGVGLLALWALMSAPTTAGRWIALVLAFGALGDVLLETSGLTVGAVAFLIGHILAAALYWTRRRSAREGTTVAILLVIGVPGVAYAVSGSAGVLLYATGLGAMAATAWISRFSRGLVGAGAVLFAASDLLIFARMGPLAGSVVPTLLVWPLYLAGQAMIAVGVVTAEQRSEDLHDRI